MPRAELGWWLEKTIALARLEGAAGEMERCGKDADCHWWKGNYMRAVPRRKPGSLQGVPEHRQPWGISLLPLLDLQLPRAADRTPEHPGQHPAAHLPLLPSEPFPRCVLAEQPFKGSSATVRGATRQRSGGPLQGSECTIPR